MTAKSLGQGIVARGDQLGPQLALMEPIDGFALAVGQTQQRTDHRPRIGAQLNGGRAIVPRQQGMKLIAHFLLADAAEAVFAVGVHRMVEGTRESEEDASRSGLTPRLARQGRKTCGVVEVARR